MGLVPLEGNIKEDIVVPSETTHTIIGSCNPATNNNKSPKYGKTTFR